MQDSKTDSPTEDTGPIPLSFPAILRNPALSDRYAHLRHSTARIPPPISTAKKDRRDEHEGKRWIRRKDNARFAGNPHIVLATKKDHLLSVPQARTTFPEPLPPYLPRNITVPASTPPAREPNSANAGRFSLSLKGMRKELRRWGTRAESLVCDIEAEIMQWLEGGTFFSPDSENANALHLPGNPVQGRDYIREVLRTPLQLVWSIADDAFARYVVHCCARYHNVVSFSKDVSGQRLTYLLRPNATRPDYHAASALDTPPVTDAGYSSQVDTESDFVSDRDHKSDVDESDGDFVAPDALTSISEGSDAPSPRSSSPASWSVIGGTDNEGDLSADDFAASVESLSLQDDVDRTPRHIAYIRQSQLRTWDHRQGRSASSPSRSPIRRPPRRVHSHINPRTSRPTSKSFYDYLFA